MDPKLPRDSRTLIDVLLKRYPEIKSPVMIKDKEEFLWHQSRRTLLLELKQEFEGGGNW